MNTAFEIFSVVTKNRCHLRHHTSQKTQKYLYNGKNIKKNFLQLRCSNVLLHLKYKVLSCELKIKFKKVAGGKALATDHRDISYMSWSFDFRMDSNSGVQLYDIQFNGDRIVYELSLQEAAATCAGYYPLPSWNKMGQSSYEMVLGVDVPETASCFDLVHMIGMESPKTFRNAVCVFELNDGIPLRRHYDNNLVNGYKFYGGMANQMLILHTIATVYNYDYMFDFIFYQNGVIEVKVSASGYIFGSFYDANMYPYAYPLHEHFTSGTHDHLINYKVDLDIGGRKNSYETIEIGIENITERWFPNRRRVQKVLKRSVKKTELEAAYKFNFDHPKYLNFFNEAEKNKMGVKKGYRIQLESMLKQLYPEDWMITPMMSWSLYQMAVTKYKENETQSSSIYNQNSPTNPQVSFIYLIRQTFILFASATDVREIPMGWGHL